MKKNYLLRFSASFILIFLTYSCALFIKPPAEPTLEHLSTEEVYSTEWKDDLDFKALQQAIEESIRYYKQLPSKNKFHYGKFVYSPEEMEASMELFLKIIRTLKGKEQLMQLREKFLFFESKNSQGDAFFTGYYEPILDGSLVPTLEFQSPVYETPVDLIEVDLGQFRQKWKDEKIAGRLKGRRLIPYDTREKIAYNLSLNNRAKPIAYVNEIELFFLQIQGSGLIRLPDGSLKRVNFASQNGHPYKAIGSLLKDKIPPDKMSMQSIKEYLYANPDEVREILSYNQSYTFFREVEDGPLGDIEVPLTPGRSIAMDRRFIPRGALAFIETELPVFENGRIIRWEPVNRFVLVQDTGGAIRDHGRGDIFIGQGSNAELIAGHLKQRGRIFLIAARKEFLK
jgi:membrane-bound lytic murein transglycosylase A